jgi:6-phosphogluconolactonase
MKVRWLATAHAAVWLVILAGCGSSSTKKISTTDTMYVAARGPGAIWGYHANFNDGSLTLVNGSPFRAESGASAIVIDPSKAFAYVANTGFGIAPGTVESFSFDLNGSMIKVGTQNVGLSPVALTMDPAGKFLFVANRDSNSISVFSVGSNASLTAVPSSPFAVSNPVALGVTPSGKILFVVDQVQALIWAFNIGANGALSSNPLLPPVGTGSAPSALAMNSLGSFLYVANRDSENVSAFSIASGTGQVEGTLSIISGSPYPAGLGPASAVVDPSGQFLYVANADSNEISGYRIRAGTGTLTTLTNSPYSTGAGPSYVAISPTNKFLYVSNRGAASLSAYSITPTTGNLAPASGAVATGGQPSGIAFGK